MSTPLDDDTIANGDVIETFHLTQLFPIVEALEDNQTNYREDIGVADAFRVDFSGTGQANEISAYQAGQQIVFKAAHANTGASTLQVVGPSVALSAKALTKYGNAALAAGDIQAGQIVMVVYNDEGSGRFELIGAAAREDGSGFYRADEGVADAYEVDASSDPGGISALADGQIYIFKAANSNTGEATLEVMGSGGSLGAKDITKRGEALVEGDILADSMVKVVYNSEGGGRFELVGESRSEDGTGFYREDLGSADAYQVDASGTADNPRVIRGLTQGQLITFKPSNNNTGSSTLEVLGPSGSLGVKPLTKQGEDLDADDLVADTMVAAIYSEEDGGRFELLGSLPASGGGGGEPGAFVGCQLAVGSDFGLTATSSTSLAWDVDVFNEGMEHSSTSEWIYAYQAGYYEVGLVLAMEFPSAESMLVQMLQGDHTGWSQALENRFDAPAGFSTQCFSSVLVYLEAGDGISWLVTSSNDDPEVLGGDLRTRCSMRLVAPVSSMCCMTTRASDEQLVTNSQTNLYWNYGEVDPNDMHQDFSEWLDAPQDGYYEVGLVLAMEMTAAESMVVKLIKDDGTESDYCVNEMDGPVGFNLYNLTPVFIQLNEGDRVKWAVTATLDEPTVLGWQRKTRATIKFLGASS